MNNFGVIEVAGIQTKATPGWAYVPDTGPLPSTLQPANRKRAARNQPGLSLTDLTTRQENKLRKDLELLNRDNPRDVNIPIPHKAGGGRARDKHTPNVRKILQSQKTFANHLDDYQALLALAETNPAAAAALTAPQTKPATPAAASGKSASPAVTPAPTPAATNQSKRSQAAAKRAAAKEKEEEKKRSKLSVSTTPAPAPIEPEKDDDVEMTDATTAADSEALAAEKEEEEEPSVPENGTGTRPKSYPPDGTILPAYNKPPPVAHPSDDDPLLVSRVPPFPSDEELRALMTAPPLNYFEARATWGEEEGRYPVRVFCEMCGYWGRIKCMKCGVRVCALDCLDAHKEECVTRYGL
ncbi:hypothetical protein QBC35DRAFT_464953 [Podospora australis]|uniref:HIT-type domain-containing protein n=1 Tax=Podospora australis TaxID=1536484 RepID=A0AAN6WQ95_9PEZI|nr:hypothetical protein QBC35DRAFT_464953 [Podospora australis]